MTTAKKYFEAIGRRKTSTARVRLTEAPKTSFLINSKALADYFPTKEMQGLLLSPFEKGEVKKHFDVSVRVSGGGINSQAGAVRHGISRALNEFDAKLRLPLKKAGLLKRDPRMKERRKYGLKKARKAPQWSKR
ncbi:MAG TPA: 30S ribosomal protein S9 [Candidatus Paceibacterota bacterium]|nr:30S ribosomal protein S9 [Candidatus Paceibacterota bacterium]